MCCHDGIAAQLHTCENLCYSTYFASENLDRLQRTFSRHVSKTHRGRETNEKAANGQSLFYFTGPGLGAYRLQLGCCTERPMGFHRRNIRGCRTTLFTCFVAWFATVGVALLLSGVLRVLTAGGRFRDEIYPVKHQVRET